MLSRPSTSTYDRLAKATLIAAAASLLVGGGLVVTQRAHDPCAVATDGLDAEGRLFVAAREAACRDYEAGRISKHRYHDTIDAIDKFALRAHLTVSAPPMPPPTMWADAVLSYSTQYSDTSWSAQQALGAPNVYPKHGDNAQAWASRTADDQDEWLELGYAKPRPVSAVEIYETFNPGAIWTVQLITTSGRRIELRPATVPSAGERAGANRLRIETPCTSEPIAAVRVDLASSTVTGWNEIDAVGLVPCTAR